MSDFWEKSFQEKGAMWGPSATDSALRAAAAFQEKGYKEVLIPGIGYGRNARPFLEAGVKIAERLYETMPGVRLFFYDETSIHREFGAYGLADFQPISEPTGLDFMWIECRKA